MEPEISLVYSQEFLNKRGVHKFLPPPKPTSHLKILSARRVILIMVHASTEDSFILGTTVQNSVATATRRP